MNREAIDTEPVLSHEQIEQFARDGYARVERAFDPGEAARIVDRLLELTEVDPHDRSTWTKANLFVEHTRLHDRVMPELYTLRTQAAFDQLLGAGRWEPLQYPGTLLGRLPGFDQPPWDQISYGHIDGTHFHHHVSSREQGLIGLFIYTDMVPEGGGTWVRVGSHHRTARILADAEPAGLSAGEICKAARQASMDLPVVELIGNAGDLLLMHPFVFHDSSKNLSDRIRVVSNIAIALHEPMCFDRADKAELSVVERVIRDSIAAGD
mgnify:CR=1 FL=1